MITIGLQRQHEMAQIDILLGHAFGPDYQEKASWSVRRGHMPVSALSYVARLHEKVVGTIRFWPASVICHATGRSKSILLLGPLAVDPILQGQGAGGKLLKTGLCAARQYSGDMPVLLVGDLGFYGRFGFQPVRPRNISLPGGRDADRLLVYGSVERASLPFSGQIIPNETSQATVLQKPVPMLSVLQDAVI